MKALRHNQVTAFLVLVLVLVSACGGSSPDTGATAVDTQTVSYLEETIPPCTPVEHTQQDPCEFQTVSHVEALSATGSSFRLGNRQPNFTGLLKGSGLGGLGVPHIVIRGTVQAGTTRCDIYPVILPDYLAPRPGLGAEAYYYCFVDVRVNEYLVGTGPPTLAVVTHRENIWPINVDNWPEVEDVWIRTLSNPHSRTATAYEGRELVMLLRPTTSIAVEAWSSRGLFRRWFVQRDDTNDIRAVAQEMHLAETAEQRARLDLSLTELESQIRAAATARAALLPGSESGSATRSETSGPSTTMRTAAGTVRPVGGLGTLEPVPLLVTDANHLQNFYVEVGAVYEGDDATTVLPPPKP